MALLISDRYRLWIAVCCATAFLLIVISQVQREVQRFQTVHSASAMPEDFPVYYVAGKIARGPGPKELYYPPLPAVSDVHHGRWLFELIGPATPWTRTAKSLGFDGTMRLATPPLSSLMMAPVSMLPPRLALLVWRGLSIVMLLVSVFLASELWKPEMRIPVFVISSAAALSFFPVTETLQQGQVGIVLLLLWTLGIYLLDRKKPQWSGACFALATLIKLTPVAVVPLFVMRRQWKWLIGYISSSCAILAFTIWQVGWHNHWVYMTQMMPSISAAGAFFANRSLGSIILNVYAGKVPLRLGDIPEVVPTGLLWINRGISLCVFVGVLVLFWRKNKTPSGIICELAIFNFVILLISPASWRHHYVVALVSLLFCWLKWPDFARKWQITNLGALMAATMIMGTVFPEYLLPHLNHAGQIALAALWPLSVLLLVACYTLQPEPDPKPS